MIVSRNTASAAPAGKWERQRLATLKLLGLLDTPPQREFDILVELAKACSAARAR